MGDIQPGASMVAKFEGPVSTVCLDWWEEKHG